MYGAQSVVGFVLDDRYTCEKMPQADSWLDAKDVRFPK
jgi:hypothetical protein